jgi:hypothetical protein
MVGIYYSFDTDIRDVDHSSSCQQMYVVQYQNKIIHMRCDRRAQGKTGAGIWL